MGDRCTRNCHYCSVVSGKPQPLEPQEPQKLAQAIGVLGLKHVVVTSVTRDDLPDQGIDHFMKVVLEIRARFPQIILEVLTPDFRKRQREAAAVFSRLPIDIFNHNIETTRGIHGSIRPGGGYQLSLNLLKKVHEMRPDMITKSGAMLGLGESRGDIREMMMDLRDAGVSMLTLGQYLQPEKKAVTVKQFITPEEFQAYQDMAYNLGFVLVESGPFVRSSYHAKDSFERLLELTQSRDSQSLP